MKSTDLAYAVLTAIGLLAAAPATPALALVIDSYVSATGLDTNTCVITAPCKTMAQAVGQTFAGGVVHCLDSNNYGGPVTITQSVIIDCSNTTAEGGPFIIDGLLATVHIIGLQLINAGSAGIDFKHGFALYVEKCTIINSFNGILFEPGSNPNTANAKLFVHDSYFSENGSGGVAGGLYIKPASGITAEVAISNSRIANNQFGIIADGSGGGNITGTVSNSVIAANLGNGITASTATSGGASVSLLIDQSQVVGNVYGGLVAGGSNGRMLVRNTSVTGNGTGLAENRGGSLFSYFNNSVDGNTTDGTFTSTFALK